ncbi:hypothetical protein PENTCL1PPCAC_18540, partial [Pristionchus entomophagus]
LSEMVSSRSSIPLIDIFCSIFIVVISPLISIDRHLHCMSIPPLRKFSSSQLHPDDCGPLPWAIPCSRANLIRMLSWRGDHSAI